MNRRLIPLLLVPLAVLAAACGSSAGPSTPTILPAQVFRLAGPRLAPTARPGRPTPVAFTILQPSGKPLTRFKTGPGPHTGVHLIIVRDDLSSIIHLHPKPDAQGRVRAAVTFPQPGRYRVLVDVYPAPGVTPLRNFQLHQTVRIRGRAVSHALPPFSPTVVTDGYRFQMQGRPRLAAIQPTFLVIHVRDPDGRPTVFRPWFGALAHAIFFRAGSLDYFHTHVCARGAAGCTSVLGPATVKGSASPGVLRVGVLLPTSGTWRLFLQTRPGGTVLTAPFTLHVR